MSKQSADLDNPIPIVTKQQMIDYIFSQPDNRMVDFNQNYFDTNCGCIMVQYGKDNGFKFHGCGFQGWERGDGSKVLTLEEYITFAHFQPHENSQYIDQCTYGEIKEFLRQKNWLPTEEKEDA